MTVICFSGHDAVAELDLPYEGRLIDVVNESVKEGPFYRDNVWGQLFNLATADSCRIKVPGDEQQLAMYYEAEESRRAHKWGER